MSLEEVEKIKVLDREFLYYKDNSWHKWKRIVIGGLEPKGEIDWYMENVVVPNQNPSIDEAFELYKKLKQKFNLTEKRLKIALTKFGKVGRGCILPDLSADAVEFAVLVGMNGSISYTELQTIPFHKVVLWKRMLDMKNEEEKNALKNNG